MSVNGYATLMNSGDEMTTERSPRLEVEALCKEWSQRAAYANKDATDLEARLHFARERAEAIGVIYQALRSAYERLSEDMPDVAVFPHIGEFADAEIKASVDPDLEIQKQKAELRAMRQALEVERSRIRGRG